MFASMALNVFSLKALGWMLILIGLVRWRVGAERFRIIAMPLYFTLLSIPWPWGVVQMIALPLQEISATLARIFLDLSGLPVLQEGIVLDTGRFKLVVEEICSGLRSFVALLTVAIFLIATGWGSRNQRWAAPFVVLGIILCGNATRLITALAIGHWFSPEWAMVWVEDISPFMLILAEAAILLLWLNAPARKHIYRKPRLNVAMVKQGLSKFIAGSPVGVINKSRVTAVGFMVVAMVTYVVPTPDKDVFLPEWPVPDGWHAVYADYLTETKNIILSAMQGGAIAKVVRVQSDSNPADIVDGQMIISKGGPGRDVDDPRFCYRSQGWRMLMEKVHTLPLLGAESANVPKVSEILEEHPGTGVIRLDWFAYKVGNRWTNGYGELRFYQLLARAMRSLDSIAVVRVSTPVGYGADREAELAQARLRLASLWQSMPLR